MIKRIIYVRNYAMKETLINQRTEFCWDIFLN